MSKRFLTAAALLALAFGGLPAADERQAPPREGPPAADPLYVRLTLYPTASLSRYDINNDVDLYEIRAYAEVRVNSPEGRVVTDARVMVRSQPLDFDTDHYEKRIVVDKDALPEGAEFEIRAGARPVFRETIPLPTWLVLQEPRPTVLDPEKDLALRWRFSRFAAPVDVHAYDFLKGGEFFEREHAAETEFVVPAKAVPPATTLRIFVIQSWLSKRFLRGEGLARGSEVNVIPWSQVFVRTK
jgi:hypothetical protein